MCYASTQACGGGLSSSSTCPPEQTCQYYENNVKLIGEEAQMFKERMLGEGSWEEGEDAYDI